MLSLALLVASIAWLFAFVIAAHSRLTADSLDPEQRSRSLARLLLLFVAWLGTTYAIGASEILAVFDSMPPRPLPVFAFVMALMIWFGCSWFTTGWSLRLPVWSLVLFHAFRILVELMLWSLWRDGTVNEVMTFEGRNFDVVAGALALVLGLIGIRRELPSTVVWIFNIVGILLLTNIIVVAALTMPTQFQVFTDGPSNTFIASAPYFWLPTVLVAAAVFGHVTLTRRLIQRQASLETTGRLDG